MIFTIIRSNCKPLTSCDSDYFPLQKYEYFLFLQNILSFFPSITNKKNRRPKGLRLCADGETRTRMSLRSLHPECSVSTDFTTTAFIRGLQRYNFIFNPANFFAKTLARSRRPPPRETFKNIFRCSRKNQRA